MMRVARRELDITQEQKFLSEMNDVGMRDEEAKRMTETDSESGCIAIGGSEFVEERSVVVGFLHSLWIITP